ncbi:hypothetical protein ACFPOG_30680 [Paenibacillus aestuarii]|uniref:Replication protein n=1 Tax=Paenibacillus aestuarii TaxID=516965 RepID=A0ABW0KGN6_9BACL
MVENDNVEILLLTNAILKDNQLSLKSKGLYFSLIFTYDEQDLTIGLIKKMSQIDSERSIRMGLKELENGGYINRKTLDNGENSWNFNTTKYKDIKKEASVKTIKAKSKNQTKNTISKKVQAKKSTRTRKTTKKTGLNRALSNFFKEFF